MLVMINSIYLNIITSYTLILIIYWRFANSPYRSVRTYSNYFISESTVFILEVYSQTSIACKYRSSNNWWCTKTIHSEGQTEGRAQQVKGNPSIIDWLSTFDVFFFCLQCTHLRICWDAWGLFFYFDALHHQLLSQIVFPHYFQHQ